MKTSEPRSILSGNHQQRVGYLTRVNWDCKAARHQKLESCYSSLSLSGTVRFVRGDGNNRGCGHVFNDFGVHTIQLLRIHET